MSTFVKNKNYTRLADQQKLYSVIAKVGVEAVPINVLKFSDLYMPYSFYLEPMMD